MLDSSEADRAHIDLIRRVGERDLAAFEELYDSCSRLVFSFALRMVRDQVVAEEIAQDVFLRVWRYAALYDAERGSVRAWLVVMTRTQALDQLRRSRRRRTWLERWRGASLDSAGKRSEALDERQTAAASAVIRVLPAADQTLMALAFRDGLSHPEIATRLGQPLGTVKTRLRRSLRLVRAATADATSSPFTWLTWPQVPTACPPPKALDRVRLIVVDDDADTLRLLTLVLERAGAIVVPAASAAQGLKRVSEAPPDVLLTDIEMPREDGYSLLQRVRRLGSGTQTLPAVAFTAHDTARDRSRVAAAGFALHIVKPVSPSLLVNRVATLVGPVDPQRAAV